ncbi:MAG: 4Fe-4S binding protein [Thermoplasmata archaeon]|nr:4Fe-4S binding protein [Thermoplasmata archaeon]
MVLRKIIKIDEEKCDGCGQCIPNCPEGALQMIDGKARLISDLFCDGLGECIGHCPRDAINVEERESEAYDERRVMGNIVKHGSNTIKAHLEHLLGHGEKELYVEAVAYLEEREMDVPEGNEKHAECEHDSCPGSQPISLAGKEVKGSQDKRPSCLRQWPVQIMLVSQNAPHLDGANILLTADCVPFAYADFHNDFIKDHTVLVGCPKLDDAQFYEEKITAMFRDNDIRSVTCVRMEVPCCSGLVRLAKSAISASGKAIPFVEVVIGINGDIVP